MSGAWFTMLTMYRYSVLLELTKVGLELSWRWDKWSDSGWCRSATARTGRSYWGRRTVIPWWWVRGRLWG